MGKLVADYLNIKNDGGVIKDLDTNILGFIGDSYSLVDEADNRDSDTTYTNDTGKPILIVCTFPSSSSDQTLHIYVDDNEIYNFYAPENTTTRNATFAVPAGSTYKYKDNYSPDYWIEYK